MGPRQQRARAYHGATMDAAPAQVWAPGDAPLPARQGLSPTPKYQAHIWSSCALPGLGHIIPLQTLFSFPGLSHKRLRRQDKVVSVCVSIPVCVSLCVSGGVCASHCDLPNNSQNVEGEMEQHQANSTANILSASLSAHFKGKHLGLGISLLIAAFLCSF